jgi:hypothetical protein
LSESVVRERYSQRISAGSIALKEFSVRTTVEDDKELYIDWVRRI